MIAGLVLVTGAAAWLTWPRADTEIRVARGGIATVIDRYGRRHPLGDTVFVGGVGARRSVRVVNDDTVQHRLAMFSADAGDSRDFTVPIGVYGGYCSAHASTKRLTFVVR